MIRPINLLLLCFMTALRWTTAGALDFLAFYLSHFFLPSFNEGLNNNNNNNHGLYGSNTSCIISHWP